MSSPDKLTELRNTVTVYENEYFSIASKIKAYSSEQRLKDPKSYIHDLDRGVKIMAKLQMAYRRYVDELEKFVPR
jgi:hypothetical protein